MTNAPLVPKDTDKKADVSHPGMMGDGTEEQNLGEPGNPAAIAVQRERSENWNRGPR